VEEALKAYKEYFGFGENPKEIFIHGRTYFHDDEWGGFSGIANNGTRVVGIRIGQSPLRLFRPGNFFALRGTAYIENDTRARLWTTGYIPRLRMCLFAGVMHR
jgi:hypothetical protein